MTGPLGLHPLQPQREQNRGGAVKADLVTEPECDQEHVARQGLEPPRAQLCPGGNHAEPEMPDWIGT